MANANGFTANRTDLEWILTGFHTVIKRVACQNYRVLSYSCGQGPSLIQTHMGLMAAKYRSKVIHFFTPLRVLKCFPSGIETLLWLHKWCMSRHSELVFVSVTEYGLISTKCNEWGGANKLTSNNSCRFRCLQAKQTIVCSSCRFTWKTRICTYSLSCHFVDSQKTTEKCDAL